MSLLTPNVLGPIGVQPVTIDFVAKNAEGSATFTVGTLCHFDLSQAETDTTKAVPGFDSVWSNMRTTTTTNAYQRWAPTAVYLGDLHGEENSLAPGATGRFRLNGIVRARVVNSASGSAPSASAFGVPYIWSKDADALGAAECATGNFTDGEVLHGWTLSAVTGSDSDNYPDANTEARFLVYHQGAGIHTWYTP